LAYQQITELKDKLTREEAYLTQAQRLTGVGSWAWDPSESHNYYSREVFNIFGLDPAKGNPTLSDFLRIYHPEDREFVEEAEKKLVSEGQGYDVKYRIIRPDGELRFVREVGTPVRENGVVTGFVGACMDVTEQERMTQELRREKLYLEDEIRTEYNFEEIIGESTVLKRILKQVETVAPTDSTVLIQGETGTGKELIARAIHSLSKRGERTFVKMNCAAIPTGLLESELFGHERGAFTGAIAQKVGRFELAHGGTLFLDEVGDVPLELQSKLLRVLQEQEFERLGSNRTIRVDVRLVAATNRDLAQMVTDKQFRSDLYYRLNVFPITAPPLRERPEDIPLLVRYFAQKYARLMNKRIETIPAEAMTALAKYHWPGNIRELENLIERSVILSQGPDLHVPLAELKAPAAAALNGAATLEAAEREHILRVLRETNWVIGGSSGAAARLGMKRTTLQSKITKLGISRRS
jgi:formate hydrogenlyase transcriptional activator